MKNNSHAFINQLLVCLLVTFCFSGSIGLGTVWMRHQISLTANANKALEQRIAEVERHLAETATFIETEQSNDVLRARNTQLRLGLVAPCEAQFVRVTQDPDRHLAAKRNRGLFDDSALTPAPVKLTLAVTR
ncbi:MAG TPA: hypothetical protein VHO24_08065 [Opitutaceae bacterium]|nr:hypothetical protein [Opitutaceae bacterium]